MGLFIRLTLGITIAIIAFIAILAIFKIVFVAAVIAAVVIGGVLALNFMRGWFASRRGTLTRYQ